MGNPKAFLTIPRQEAGYRPVHDRINDFGEVEQTLNTSERKQQASRCMDCGVPFCHWACPLGNRPPEFQDALYKGKWEEAYEILSQTNDFPEFTGRICPALCEKSCVLKLAIDDPVTIREDEAAIIEAAFREGYIKSRTYPRNGKKVAVVGSGPAGMAAALKARESGVEKIIILERAETLGGILEQCIHTGFGLHYFGEELSGPEYAARFIELVEDTDIVVKTDTMVLSISDDNVVTAVNKEDGLIEIDATAVILAMGCRERPRGALNIAGTRCAGVLSAGTAQKYVNIDGYMPGKEVVILGSGDIGLIMARRMTLEGAHVKMVCELMPYSSGLTRNIVQCLNDFDIPLKLSTTVIDIHGKERLEGVTIAKVDENRRPIPGTEEYVPCDTLMLSVGLIPENELSKNMGIEFDRVTGGPIVDEYRETTHPGVFACGNVLHVHDLVDFVTLESQTAGEGAARYIKNGGNKEKKYVKTRGINGVRYIVPQKIALGEDEDVKLFFRVGDVHKNAKVVVTYNGETLISKKRPRLAPGEMENVIIKSDMLKNFDENGIIEIQVEE